MGSLHCVPRPSFFPRDQVVEIRRLDLISPYIQVTSFYEGTVGERVGVSVGFHPAIHVSVPNL